jgi:hypothetical protein
VRAALFAVFRLAMLPNVPEAIAGQQIVHAILHCQGLHAQRLQIFSSLVTSEELCRLITVSDGVLKLVLESMHSERLADFALKLIGSLSSHEDGRTLIDRSGLLNVFSEMFLSSSCHDMAEALSILSNIVEHGRKVPRVSLVISCLMQDLRPDLAHRTDILQTLIILIGAAPADVQEHDLQNSVLPFLSPKE